MAWRYPAGGNSTQGGWLLNPFDRGGAKITLRSWLSLLNFKANHRKVIITDRADGRGIALVASANPHDASSAHSNVALQFSGEPARAVLNSELAIARFSGWSGKLPEVSPAAVPSDAGSIELAYLTEGAILERVVQEINQTQSGDRIQMAMFYLSERSIINALRRAASVAVSRS